MSNITDKVIDGQATLICTICGATHLILQYEFDGHYDFPVINTPKSIAGNEAFYLKHSLCKIPEQVSLFEPAGGN